MVKNGADEAVFGRLAAPTIPVVPVSWRWCIGPEHPLQLLGRAAKLWRGLWTVWTLVGC